MILNEFDRPRVLIVYDQAENLVILADMLKAAQVDIFVASSAKDALQRLEANSIDLVLLDVVMPDVDGYSVCETIKSNPKTKDVVVIFVSVLYGVEDKLKGFAKGADDYLFKPLIERELVARVSLHLHKIIVFKSLKRLLRRSYHELYNPLAVINTSLEMHDIKHGPSRYTDSIAAASKTLQLAYNDLYYSLNDAKREAGVVKIDLAKFVGERIDFFASLANIKNIAIDIVADDESYVWMREVDLLRVVDNSLSNAVKYAKMDTVILVRVVNSGDSVEFSCQNSGANIKNPNRVFEDGYREGFDQIGMGIGLEIVASICRAYGIAPNVASSNAITKFAYLLPKVFKGVE